jgi:hypothetical protein
MKIKLLLLAASFFLFNAEISAQSRKNLKLHAYHQSIIPGIQKEVLMDDSGEAYLSENRSKVNYLIFLEHRPKRTFKPLEIWIGNKGYSIKVNKIESTPVTLSNNTIPNKTEKTILVPETNNTVLSISLDGLLEDQSKAEKFNEDGNQTIRLIYKRKCRKKHTLESQIIPVQSTPMM